MPGHGMQKPALALVRRGDLHDRAVIPVGFAKRAGLVDALIEPFENAAFPAAGCTLGGHAFLRVPAAAVGFPGHLGALADLLQLEIAVTRFFGGIRFILLALDMRSGSEHTSQYCRRVRHPSAGAAI